jgi:LacI family transcriptional regulator
MHLTNAIMKPKVTIKNIAKDLGVSVSTVSKALSDSPEISDATKIRIQEYAKLQNYKPNTMAKNLKNQRTNTLGVIIPNILNPFFAKVFSGIEQAANEKGYNVVTYISNESMKKEMQDLDLLSNGTVDGFILSIAEETQTLGDYTHFKNLLKEGTPIVMFDRVTDEVPCDKVIVDDYDSAIHATKHLIKTNCKKIALLSSIDNLSVGKLRADGYFKALEDEKIERNNSIIIQTDNIEDFDAALDQLFEKEKFDGVFAIDEHAAVMAMKKALKKKINIPEDLSIIGFADGVWSRRLTPSLSTVSQHGPEIGKVAANMLINRIEAKVVDGPKNYKTEIIKTELRYRESTRK